MSEEKKTDHDLLVEMHSVLLGSDGQNGLCRRVNKLETTVNRILIGLAFLAGTGIIGTGIFEFVTHIK